MKTQLYTNIALSVIALLLVAILLQDAGTFTTGILKSGRKDVRIVAIARPSTEELKSARTANEQIWSELPMSGDVNVISGDINVDNEPIEVTIQP